MLKETKPQLDLTRCEAEVMDVVWAKGYVTVQEVVDTIDRNLAYTTVMTTMRILEGKKFLQRGEKRGRAFTYTPAVSQEQVRAGMLKSLTDQLFGGSARSLVLSLIRSSAVSPEDIEAVKKAAAELGDE